VSKADTWIDMGVLEQALRDDLDAKAPRATAVLDPLRLVITNWPAGTVETCSAPVHPQRPEMGQRSIPISGELWIEREDFAETPPKGFFRLSPGNMVRLRYGYVIKCTACEKNAQGEVIAVLAELMPDSRSGTPGADAYKVKGNIHWVSAAHSVPAEVRLYDRLFREPTPDAGGRDCKAALNPESRRLVVAQLEPSLRDAQPEQRFQFERHGYFVADRHDCRPGAPVFNRAVSLRDSWGGAKGR
jgi:glutaminyl-tRNA synthetase